MDPTEIMTLSLPTSTACNSQQRRLLLPPPANASLPRTLNPIEVTLQSHASAPLHDLDFDTNSHHLTDARFDPERSLSDAESDRDEPDGARMAANLQGEDNWPATHRAFPGELLGNDPLPHTMDPLQFTLQPRASALLHDLHNVDFDPNVNDLADARFDPERASDTSSDSDDSSSDSESERDEPDGRMAANLQGEGHRPATQIAFPGALLGNDSRTMNPLQSTLQPHASPPPHDLHHVDFDPNDNDPADARFDQERTSDTSSDSDEGSSDSDTDQDSSSSDSESDLDEPDGARIAANAQGEGATGSQSDPMDIDSDGPDGPRPTAKDSDDGQVNEAGDTMEESPGSDDDSDEGPSPETFTPSKGGNLNSNRSSGPGVPNAPTKRRRSISPVVPGGSAENPIDVDQIASLFEPIIIREYVWVLIIRFPYAEIPCR